MSDPGFLEKLLDGVEVKWKPLEDVTLPTSNIRWADNDRSFRYIDLTSVDRETGTISDTKEITAETAPSRAQKLVETDDLIFATTRPAQQRFCLIPPEWSGEVASTGYCVLRPDQSQVLPGWLLHWISSTQFRAYVEEHQTGSAYPAISDGKVKAFNIPIPCPDEPEKSLALQREIVRILDSFTELTAELTAELELRKKQYNHYRDQLLTFEDGDEVEEVGMGEIYDFQYGKGNTIPKVGGAYPVYGSNGIVGAHDEFNSEDSPVIGHIGAYAGIVNWGEGKHFVTYNGVICKHVSEKVLPKYAYYLLLLQDYGSKSNSASQPFVSYHILEAPKVLIPSLEEQARIVSILDKFDTLTTSLSEGLPCEIKLRQTQYEHYRDLLLSFPKPAGAADA